MLAFLEALRNRKRKFIVYGPIVTRSLKNWIARFPENGRLARGDNQKCTAIHFSSKIIIFIFPTTQMNDSLALFHSIKIILHYYSNVYNFKLCLYNLQIDIQSLDFASLYP